MNRRIRFERRARLDLFDSIDWLNKQQSNLGWQFADELEPELLKIAADPLRFTVVGRNRSHRRALLVTRFRFTIYFKMSDDEIVIASVFHPKRNPEVLKHRGIT